jgi:predicted transcriptional regulator
VTVQEVAHTVRGKIITGAERTDCSVTFGFASDLMSDVLTLTEEAILLITGLTGAQAVRTAVMADIEVILLVRGKNATPDMIALAKEHGIVIIECGYSTFKACGILHQDGLEAIY